MYTLCHKPTFFCSSLLKGEPARVLPEEFKGEKPNIQKTNNNNKNYTQTQKQKQTTRTRTKYTKEPPPHTHTHTHTHTQKPPHPHPNPPHPPPKKATKNKNNKTKNKKDRQTDRKSINQTNKKPGILAGWLRVQVDVRLHLGSRLKSLLMRSGLWPNTFFSFVWSVSMVRFTPPPPCLARSREFCSSSDHLPG